MGDRGRTPDAPIVDRNKPLKDTDKCTIMGCDRRSSGYYDLTITGIGDFVNHCDIPEHKNIVYEYGAEVDRKRRARIVVAQHAAGAEHAIREPVCLDRGTH